MAPFYDFACEKCGKRDEICCSFSQLGRFHPRCCGEPMARDYRSEHSGFVGRGYPFVDDGITGTPIEVRDLGHHRRLLRENQMDFHEPRAESRYRRKHIKDFANGGKK